MTLFSSLQPSPLTSSLWSHVQLDPLPKRSANRAPRGVHSSKPQSQQEGPCVPLPPKSSRTGAPVLLLHLSQTLPLPSLSFPSGRCYKRCSASMSSFPFQVTVKGPQGGGHHTRVTFRFQTAGHPQLIPAWSLTEKGTGPCPPLWSLPPPDKLLLKAQLASGMGVCVFPRLMNSWGARAQGMGGEAAGFGLSSHRSPYWVSCIS